jgi:subtilisin family serine protease
MRLATLFVLALSVSTAFAGVLTSGLEKQLNNSAPNDELKVLLSFGDRSSVEALDQDLHQSCTTLAIRHERVLNLLQEEADRDQAEAKIQLEQLLEQKKILGYSPHWILNGIVVRATAEVVPSLAQLSGVEIVEANLVAELIEPVEIKAADARDSSRNAVAGVEACQAPRVWHELGIWGEGALVANMDTGVDGNHVALTSRWRGNHAPASECWLDLIDDGSTTPQDGHGHGSHVMGTITGLAVGDSIGICPGAEWIATNPINQGADDGFDNDIIVGLEWFADPDGNAMTLDDVPDVVQHSWGVNEDFAGYTDCDSRWWDAIDNVEAAGVCQTWSAGNEGSGSETLRSPADRATSATNCFSVGSTMTYSPYTISSFSSRGPSGCGGFYSTKPEICAPGSDIYSVQAGGGYTMMSGTSMAGPHIAGVVGLMRSANPDIDVQSIKVIMMETATDLGSAGEDNTYGWGIVNAYDAVLAAMTGYGEVAGTITDATSYLAIEGAFVRHESGSPATTSAEDASYSLYLPAGVHTLESGFFGYGTESQSIEILSGETVVLDFALSPVPNAILSGVIMDAAGTPIHNAILSVVGAPVDDTICPNGLFSISLPAGEDYQIETRSTEAALSAPTQADGFGYRAWDANDGGFTSSDVTLAEGGLAIEVRGPAIPTYDSGLIDPDTGGHGTAMNFTGDDETLYADLPFTFSYYGVDYNELSVCGNGWVALGHETSTDYSGYIIPDATDGPMAMLAPYWEDLSPQQVDSGNISTYYDVDAGVFTVEFNHIRQYSPATDFESFRLYLLDPAVHETPDGNGIVIFDYFEVSNIDNAAIGIESPDGTIGIQVLNGRTGGAVDDGVWDLNENCPPIEAGLQLVFCTAFPAWVPSGLNPVTDLSIHVSTGNFVALTWSAVAGASSYRVEKALSLDSPWEEVGVTVEPSYSNLAGSAGAIYQVIAVD